MSAKVVSGIRKKGHVNESSVSKNSGLLMRKKSIPSLLFCHSIFLGVGIDETKDLIVDSDPQQTCESTDIWTIGTSVKKKKMRKKLSNRLF